VHILLVSRFLFGFGGSKVVHRKYIANFVAKPFWTKYYSRLIFISYLGMCFGPLSYLIAVYMNKVANLLERNFVLPGYYNLFIFVPFLILVMILFRTRDFKGKDPDPKRRRSQKLFKTITTSNYSLDSKSDE
jgi:hypothetical protein